DGIRDFHVTGVQTCALPISDELSRIPELETFDLIQAPLNILDKRLITSGWLQRLRERHIEVHARSIFMQGLLLMEPCERPARFRSEERRVGKAVRTRW